MKFVLWVPHTSNIIPASRCNSSVDAKRLGDGSQLLLSMALTLGFWLLLSLSLGLGWSNAGWPGHYLRECACLSKSPCSRPSKLFPRRKYVLSGWDFFCLLLGKTLAGNFWVLLSFCLPLLERPDAGLLKHISSQVQSSKTLSQG